MSQQYFLNQPYYYCAADGIQDREIQGAPSAPTRQPITQVHPFVFGRGAGAGAGRDACIRGSCDYTNQSQGLPLISPNSAGALSQPSPHAPGRQHTHQQQQGTQQSSEAITVGLKVFSPSNKKEFKMYTLRNIQANDFNNPTSLKTELFNQLGDEIICGTLNFDIGYLVHNEKKWIHNAEDARDALALVTNGGKLTLWCTGISPKNQAQGQKRVHAGSVPSSEEPTKKKKKQSFTEEQEERMTELVASLRDRHGAKYSTLQYRLWAEMFINETHKMLDTPPPYPLFREEKRPRASSASGQLNEALTGLANSIAIVLVPNQLQQSASSSSTASPTKTAQLRSKYMEQLKNLIDLRDLGALTPDEYEEEREVIVNSMRKLKN